MAQDLSWADIAMGLEVLQCRFVFSKTINVYWPFYWGGCAHVFMSKIGF